MQALAGVLLEMIAGNDGGELGRRLMVTEPLARAAVTPEVVTFSGGVA